MNATSITIAAFATATGLTIGWYIATLLDRVATMLAVSSPVIGG